MSETQTQSQSQRSKKIEMSEAQKSALLQFLQPIAKYLFGDYIGIDGRMKRIQSWESIRAFGKE